MADERHPAPTVAAPAPAAAKPAPAAPAIPAPLLEAAQLHAAGDPLGASKKLEAALKTGGKFGNFTDNLWLALFEVLQDLNRRDAFDKLALTYAQHFEKSPPTWSEAAAAAIATTPAGVVLFRVPPELTTAVGPALKDLMQQARTCQTMEIDVSGVTTVDDAGATLAIRAIKALRDAKRETVLIGAENLAFRLSQTLEVMERRNEPQWHLLIAMYDSLGDQNAFEDAAVNYAVTFEVSPPSWEVRDRSNVRKSASPPVSAPTPPAGPALVGEVCSPCATIIQAITAKGAGDIMVDASQLKRIEAAAADEILACLKKSKEAGATITVSGLPPLPYILLTHHHWAEVATLKQRKL
ncbi:MAG: hypothetical protein IPG34_11895 [Rhodocyclaceae bacterium]|nr:hypothetical protein [Rhodocyclaceae bacterium]